MLPRQLVRFLAVFCSVSPIFDIALAKAPPQKDCGADAMLTKREEERFLQQKTQVDRFARTGSLLSLAPQPDLASAAQDVGSIAVIDDSDGVRVRRNPFNLQLKRLTFTYLEGGKYSVAASNTDLDVAGVLAGTKLVGLGDDDTREMPLPFEFPFFRDRHSSVFVNSDGNLSFTAGDGSSSDRNLARVAAGPPRICPLYTDLDPTSSQQGVRFLSESGRVVISWANVPLYGTGRIQTFQAALYPNGNIEITYSDTNVINDDAVVGISPGRLQGETRLVTLNLAGGDQEIYTSTVAEVFAGTENYDVARALQRFYTTHDDAYDNVFVFNSMQMPPSWCPQAIACTDVVRNNVIGYGRPISDDAFVYGSPKRLEAVIDMGPVEGYPDNPFQPHPGRLGTGDTGINIFGHEASHRYLVWSSPRDANGQQYLVGRQGLHWNFYFNSEGSLVEGNRIEDLGPDVEPRFVSVGAGERVAPIDQYFFGWRAAQDVPPSFFVQNPGALNSAAAPRIGARFSGVRQDITLDDIIASTGQGPRKPDHEIAPRKYRWAILVITRAGEPLPTSLIDKLERYRRELPNFWARVSEGRSELDVEFRSAVEASFAPYGEFTEGRETEASIRVSRPVEQDLRITLESTGGPNLEIPAEVVIPAGSDEVRFPLKAARAGVQILTLRPSDTRYETRETRIRVNVQTADPVE